MPDQELRLQAAILAVQNRKKPKIALVAKEFDVPRSTLRDRLKGRQGRSQPRPWKQTLTEIEERSIVEYAIRMDRIGIYIRHRHLAYLARKLVETRIAVLPIDELMMPDVSRHWAKRFLLRYRPQIEEERMGSIELARQAAHDPLRLGRWFHEYTACLKEYSIQPEDIWNMDETGFRIGVGKSSRVVVDASRRGRKKESIPSTLSRDYVSVVETVSASGTTIPPFFVVKAKVKLLKWYEEDFSMDSAIEISPTGYMNDNLCQRWLAFFEKQTKKRQLGAYRMLICDGYGSHLTIPFIEFCADHGILLFCFPSHSTHLLQPLDVVVFGEYKKQFANTIDDANSAGAIDFTVSDFLARIESVRARTFKPKIIKAGFRKTGLWPVDPALIVAPLLERQFIENGGTDADRVIIERASSDVSASDSERCSFGSIAESNDDDDDDFDGNLALIPSSPPLPSQAEPVPQAELESPNWAAIYDDDIAGNVDYLALTPALPIRPNTPVTTSARPRSPTSPTALLKDGRALQGRLSRQLISSPTRQAIDSFIRDTAISSNVSLMMQGQIGRLEAANASRQRRKSARKWQITDDGGLITREEALLRLQAREDQVTQKAFRKEERIRLKEDRATRAAAEKVEKEAEKRVKAEARLLKFEEKRRGVQERKDLRDQKRQERVAAAAGRQRISTAAPYEEATTIGASLTNLARDRGSLIAEGIARSIWTNIDPTLHD